MNVHLGQRPAGACSLIRFHDRSQRFLIGPVHTSCVKTGHKVQIRVEVQPVLQQKPRIVIDVAPPAVSLIFRMYSCSSSTLFWIVRTSAYVIVFLCRIQHRRIPPETALRPA